MIYTRPELLDKLAAEYVVGTLSGAARKRFERVLAESPPARDYVRQWEETLSPLADQLPEVMPSSALWQRIVSQLPGHASIKQSAKQSASGWRNWFVPLVSLSFGFMLALGIGHYQPGLFLPAPPPPQQVALAENVLPESYVGLLTDASGTPMVLAASRRHERALFVKLLKPLVVPVGRTLVLWAVPKDQPPFRIGILASKAKQTLTLSAESETLFKNVPHLVASFEAGDQPITTPTSPYVLTGNCVKLW